MSPTTGDGLISMEDGAAAGRQTALATLATLRRELGSLDKVKCLVKTLGLVNATTDFENHVAVVNVSTATALLSSVIVPARRSPCAVGSHLSRSPHAHGPELGHGIYTS